jgi:hypothetical protein
MAYKLINKTTNEIERISDDRIFFDDTKYDLVEYDTVARRKKAIEFIKNADSLADIKKILIEIVKEII